jgi:hypothetical protein
MVKRGRPSDYSPDWAEAICAGIAEGLLLPEVCKRPGMPSPGTIFVWLNRFPDSQEQYARAKEIQCEILAAETKNVADTPRLGRKVKTFANGSQEVTEGDMVDRSRLMMDARKWLASKVPPKKYGDKKDATVPGRDGGPIQEHLTVEYIRQKE